MNRFYLKIVFCIAICWPTWTCAQSPLRLHNFGKGNDMVSYQFGYGSLMLHEIKVDHFFSDHFSLLYCMRFSRPTTAQNSSDAEFTAPLGASVGVGLGFILGGGSACGYMDPDIFLGTFVASCMIPDGIAGHIYIHKNMDISPYINVTGLTLASRENVTRFYYTPSAGIRFLFTPSEHLVLSLEQQVLARPERTFATNLAAGIGVRF